MSVEASTNGRLPTLEQAAPEAPTAGLDEILRELQLIRSTLQAANAPVSLLVGRREAAQMLALSESSLDRLVALGKVPKPSVVGGRRLFSRQELERFVAAGCDMRKFTAMHKE